MTNPDPASVRRAFSGIAKRYDLANHLLSGGIDFLWRRKLVREVRGSPCRNVLDLATGSGDVALAIRAALPAADHRVTGLDFCPPMLEQAERKRDLARIPTAQLRFLQGDCLELPFEDQTFDVLTIAFGLRNLADRPRAYGEMLRVLRSGGRLLVLEFSRPRAWLRPLYHLYLRHLLPLLAFYLTKDRQAYEYLGTSISAFPNHRDLAEEMITAGFAKVKADRLTAGIVALHQGQRT